MLTRVVCCAVLCCAAGIHTHTAGEKAGFNHIFARRFGTLWGYGFEGCCTRMVGWLGWLVLLPHINRLSAYRTVPWYHAPVLYILHDRGAHVHTRRVPDLPPIHRWLCTVSC